MTTENGVAPLFEICAESHVARTPEFVYSVVSDLPRSHQWSEECTGGEWIHGAPGAVGSVFRGHNFRRAEVVAWAPVVRGSWTTTSEVTTAEPGHRFSWAMRTHDGRAQDSVWGFTLRPADGGTRLTHHFRMGTATEGIRGITAEMNDDRKRKFFDEWRAKVQADMAATVERLRKVIETS
ncbi:SRPBCC family protein [Streptomyces sp. Qhu-G9]|uniref:SRPBCC family protein n=1 Tax=Streptomyces sp. Qhu-G9 TaxID=3452799 RepID=UPI0022AC73D3|nr:SRPBCC family protein [Streptomyces aurantiacus]WAU83974.1 SRPBCC family protein [Streptomyces aurantiacus]